MPLIHRSLILCATALLSACNVVPPNSLPAGNSIQVDHPEIFDNAQLQSQFDALRGQLAALGIIDTGTLTGSLGAVQGTSISQSNFSLQAVGRATPSITSVVPAISAAAAQGPGDTRTTTTPGLAPTLPAAATAPTATGALPTVTSDAIGLIDKQMQLESQLQGYQLLLGGSDFARYTIAGQAKDRVVIGFPITISPQDAHKNMAAEVEITYFPPNANQFQNLTQCQQTAFFTTESPHESRYSDGDHLNALNACREQESTPTIINILPAERSYNVIGVSSSATSFGAAAVVGTVSLGASGGTSKQTQYLVAQQDTVALQGDGDARCVGDDTNDPTYAESNPSSDEVIRADPKATQSCLAGTRGVRFKWQFRPVLGEAFVRAGRRVTFVQLAIPNVRRPYPNYGGIVYVKTTWKPFDAKTGVVRNSAPGAADATTDPHVRPERVIKNVLGHTFISAEVSEINTSDLGSGSLLVSVKGTYLTGATVRIGGTILNNSSPGFIADYNSLQFVATAQSLAQSGAVLISSEGVEAPINLSSVCKSWDTEGECALKTLESDPNKLRILGVSVFPVSDTTSLLKVKVDQASLRLESLTYYHYQRDEHGDVAESLDKRIVDTRHGYPDHPGDKHQRMLLDASVNKWPVVLSVGGKTYGFSDLPFQAMENDGTYRFFSVVAANDSINASPQIKLQRLFGNPDENSDWQSFIPPGRLSIAVDPGCSAPKGDDVPPATNDQQKKTGLGSANQAQVKDHDKGKEEDPHQPQKPKPVKGASPCGYVVSGAGVDEMKLGGDPPKACKVVFDDPNAYERNARGLKAAKCARQIALQYQSEWDNHSFDGEIVLSIPVKPVAPATPPPDTTPGDGPTPNFKMVRSGPLASSTAGLATVTVGIQNLKDQTATVSVENADIVTATDGSQNALPIQAGNQVIVAQDTNIFLQVRNLSPKGFNVQAEGKNGTTSTGKLKFINNFLVTKDAAAGGGTAAKTSGASK